MRLIDRMRRGGAARASSLPALSDAQSVFVQTYGAPDREPVLPTFQSFANLGYGGNAIVFGAVLARLQLFSEARFAFRAVQDKRLFGTEALGLLEEPWPGGSTGELLARMEQDASLAGNAFVRSDGEHLERLRPDLVTIVSVLEDDGFGRSRRRVVGYTYDATGADPGRGLEVYDVDEVAHWSPIPDPLASFRGMSWLTPIVREIDADSAMTEYKRKHLDNAATPNLLVKYERRLFPQDVADLRSRFEATYSGSENAGRALILDEGADATVIGSTFAGMAFDAVQSVGEARIAVASGVPPVVMGLSKTLDASSSDAYYLQALRRFADITMRPNWRTACAALSKLVDVPAGSHLWFDTSDISALQPGEKDAAETSQQQAGTINTLIMAGFEPASAVAAVSSGDMSLLRHSGLVSVQMQSISGAPDAAQAGGQS